ncbi:MAG: DUF5060 domain-containing protein [Anaerolineae bacterium]
MKKLVCLIITMLLLVSMAHAQAGTLTVTPLLESVGLYEKFEAVVVTDAAFSNPYDPADIQVMAEFTAPSGSVVQTAGFYYQDFSHSAAGLQATNDFSWRVRFTPQEVGEYQYRVTVTTASGESSSEAQRFTATASENPGFVRVDSLNPRYFAFDNGDSYFPIGLNIGWSTNDTISDYETWLDDLQASGGNFIRVWMAPWDMGIEWLDTGLGNYSARMGSAYELDQVIEMAAQRGIYIMLSLLNHGQFSTTTNAQWNENPYNDDNGGPCPVPECFASDPTAIHYWEQRLHYIVARWGYSPNIMAWEWWNEVNWTPIASEQNLAPWMERNVALMHELDPYQHLLTHSGSHRLLDSVWTLLDFGQDHFYNKDDFPSTFATTIPQWVTEYPDRPFLVGEFGRSAQALYYDVDGVELHIGIWSAPMNGAAGTAMSWWWDSYIAPNDLWDTLYTGISRFFADEDMGAEAWTAPITAFAETANARVFGLQSDDHALLWVVSSDYSTQYLGDVYNEHVRNGVENPLDITFPEVAGAVLVVNGLAAGDYTVEVWDTFSGEILGTQNVSSSDGRVQVALPTFDRDLALKIKPA